MLSSTDSWRDKSLWFHGVNEDYGSFDPTPEAQAKVDELIRGIDDPMRKIAVLTHWVADNMRYSGISMGKGEGYTLHNTRTNFTDRCGVCKDKAALLISRHADWRIRFHLFFGGMALLLATGGWAIPDGLLGDKTPERAMRELPARLGFDPAAVKLFTTPSTMHAVAWVYGRKDVHTLNSRGELDYGDDRAKEEGRTGVAIDQKELDRMLASC